LHFLQGEYFLPGKFTPLVRVAHWDAVPLFDLSCQKEETIREAIEIGKG